MTQRIQRSVFVGLGGTGQMALLSLKRKLLEVYGEVPPACSLVCFDTDAPGHLQTFRGETVTLSPGEFVKLEVRNPRPVTLGPEVSPWWSRKIQAKVVSKGAGGVRQVGRLALFANAGQVVGRLRAAMERVMAWPVGRTDNDRFEVIDDSLAVHIISSIAGGTGAGMFLDMGLLAKTMVNSRDTIVAHLLMPDVFVGLPGVYNAERNACAAVQEIDLLAAMDYESDYSYLLNGTTVEVRESPFDVVCLVNNRNSRGIHYPDVKELTEFIGLGAFLSTGKIGQAQASVWDNVAQRALQRDPWDDRRPNYTSYGLAELFFDRERYATYYCARIAANILHELFSCAGSRDIDDEVRSFLLRNSLVEDDGDQVIDAILCPGDYKKFPVPQAPSGDDLKAMLARRDGYLAQVSMDLDARASGAGARLRAEKLSALNDYVADRLSEVGGFVLCVEFLDRISGTFAAFREMLDDERQELKEQLENMTAQHGGLQKDAEDAVKAFFGGAEKKRRVANKIAQTLNAEAELLLQIRRREEGMAFFATMAEEARRLRGVLANLAAVATQAQTMLSTEIESLRSRRVQAKPFEISLEPPGLYDESLGQLGAEFLNWLPTQNLKLSDLGSMRASDMIELLMKYAVDHGKVREISAMTIDDALRRYDAAGLVSLMKTLIETSAPMWSYNDGEVSRYGGTEILRLIGLPDEQTSVFTPEIRVQAGCSPSDGVLSTGDEQRVFALTAEYALPAFVIDHFGLYRERFLQATPVEREKYYINRQWISHVADLMPRRRSGDSVKWAAALAMPTIKRDGEFPFGGVKKVGNNYYFISEQYGDPTRGHQRLLDQGRIKACERFLESPELIAEVESQLAWEIQRQGTEAVARAVKEYRDQLFRDAQNIKQDEVRAQVSQELEDLDELYEDITTIR